MLEEYYIENLRLSQEFLTNDTFPSMKYYLDKFKTEIVINCNIQVYYNILLVGDNIYNVNVIGEKKSLVKLNMILENYSSNYQKFLEKEAELRGVKQEIEDFSKKYGRILGH